MTRARRRAVDAWRTVGEPPLPRSVHTRAANNMARVDDDAWVVDAVTDEASVAATNAVCAGMEASGLTTTPANLRVAIALEMQHAGDGLRYVRETTAIKHAYRAAWDGVQGAETGSIPAAAHFSEDGLRRTALFFDVLAEFMWALERAPWLERVLHEEWFVLWQTCLRATHVDITHPAITAVERMLGAFWHRVDTDASLPALRAAALAERGQLLTPSSLVFSVVTPSTPA